MNENTSKDEIFAKALSRIIENQIEIKKYIRLVNYEGRYGDCYLDNLIIDQLDGIV